LSMTITISVNNHELESIDDASGPIQRVCLRDAVIVQSGKGANKIMCEGFTTS